LHVVDQAHERLLLGRLGAQGGHGESHEEPIGRRAGAKAERRGERLALRSGQPLEPIQ